MVLRCSLCVPCGCSHCVIFYTTVFVFALFLQSSTHTIYKQMYDFMEMTQPSPYVDNNTQGWERVLAGKNTYAYLVESTVNEYFNQKKPCKTMKVGPNLNQNGYGIATRKGSKLR